jgi:CRP-like cAMP-binding protein
MPELLHTMKSIELFQGLDDSQLQRIADISRRETFNQGQIILRQDAAGGDKMYIIAQGQVEISVQDPKGNSRLALYLGEGQVFGEVALLDYGSRSATVTADEDGTVVYALARDSFDNLCMSDHLLGYLVMRNLALDLTFKLRHRNTGLVDEV